MAEYDQWLQELSKRTGASVEQSDADALATKNPEDVEAHKKALETQYAQRGGTQRTGDGQVQQQSQPVQAPSNNPTQSWNNSAQDPFPSWYRDLMQQSVATQQAQAAETKGRADSLYSTLNADIDKGINVNANDPIIRGQVDAYAAQGERAKRNYISDVAEGAGPLANIRGEERMAAERLGQGVSGFQSELMGRELGARRDDYAQRLAMMGGMVSGDQTRGLQEKLSLMDQAIGEAGVGTANRGLDIQKDLGFAGINTQRDLGFAGINTQRDLGFGGLDLQRQGMNINADQFLRELALREWQLGDDSDYRWASL
jgi:hypothetical protein